MAKKKKKITKKTKIGELLDKHPELAAVLMDTGLHCVGCPMTIEESLEDGAKAHGMSNKEVDELIERLNNG